MAQKVYPTAKIAMGTGDLLDVTNVSFDVNNDAKQVSTLRRPQAGVAFGPGSSSISFQSAISEDGPERNYFKMCQRREITQLRIKLPGAITLTYEGAFSSVKGDSSLDNATTVDCTFIGKLADQ